MVPSTPSPRRHLSLALGTCCAALLLAACVAPPPVPPPATPPSRANPFVGTQPVCNLPAAAPAGTPELTATPPAPDPPVAPGEASPGSAEVELVATLDGEVRVLTVPESVAPAAVGLLDAAGTVVAAGPVVEVSVEESTGRTADVEPAATNDPLRGDQWALDAVPVEPLWDCSRGAGVDLAVIDTGVVAAHTDLAGRVTGGVSTLGGSTLVGAGGTDVHGHGTHVAGIAAATADNGAGITGVAPAATIMPVKVLGNDGSGTSDDVARGMIWAVDNGAEVLNLSLSSNGASAAMSAAVDHATANGVTVVAAAGNSGVGGAVKWPAAEPAVVAVGSIRSSGDLSSFSSRGFWVDVVAPGQSIVSSIPGGWGTKSGTSMASPYVAGIAVLILGAKGPVAPADMQAALAATALDLGAPGRDDDHGHGLVDPAAAHNAL